MASRIVPEGGWSSLKPFKTPRVQKPSHLQFIKRLPCACCLAGGHVVQADDPMHIRAASALHGKEETGGGRKSDDRWTLPGCRAHHDKQHSMSELNFWKMFNIDPFLLALTLWGLTGDHHAAIKVMQMQTRGG